MAVNRDTSDILNASHFLLDKHIERGDGARLALIEPGKGEFSYAQLGQTANQLAQWFALAGAKRHDRVCLFLPDGFDLVASFLGCLKSGAVAVPLNSFVDETLLRVYLQDSAARLLVTHRQCQAIATKAAQACTEPVSILYLDDERWRELSPVYNNVETKPEDAAFWLYTSGSTGRPKAVVHAHGGIVPCATGYGQDVLRITAADRVFSTSKLFFAYGLGNSVLFPLSVGASAVVHGGRVNETIIGELLDRYRPTLFFTVPTIYSRLLRNGISRDLFTSVRMCISAGEALPIAVAEQWSETTDQSIYDGIGTTETMHIFCSNRQGDVRLGATGRPVRNYELVICDEAGNAVESGHSGYLHVRGPTLARGYWDRDSSVIRPFPSGWLCTGDVFREEGGYFIYSGRSDDCFKSSGQWVSPLPIEELLLVHPRVQEAAVVAAPDSAGLMAPHAFVVVTADQTQQYLTVDEIRQQLTESMQRLPKYMRPRVIEIVSQLPRTPTGKIARQQLRTQPTTTASSHEE